MPFIGRKDKNKLFLGMYEHKASSVNSLAQSHAVYPNPAYDFIELDDIAPGSEIKIYDSMGRLAAARIYKGDKLDVSALNPGLYFIRSSNGETMKFVKR